jgi:predicted acetyltransferase
VPVEVEVEVRPLSGDEEARQAFDVLRRSFNIPRSEDDDVTAHLGPPERTRVVVVDGRVAAFSRLRAFGQYFGGRRVPLGGFTAVGTAPEYRNRGYARLVTAAHFEAMRNRGEVLAGLYPSSTPLYRGVGFGLGGVWATHRLPAERLRALPGPAAGSFPVRRATRADLPAVYACYAACAPRVTGWLDRPQVWWDRILIDKWDDRYVYVVDDAGSSSILGYVGYDHTDPSPSGYTIRVLEVVTGRADVARALWRLVGSSSTFASDVIVTGPPEHPLLLLLPEQDLKPHRQLRFMLRLVDAPGAVAARGFPTGLEATADLEIVGDCQCPWNEGRWRLVVGDGEGTLKRGGAGTVRLRPPALASLWSGYAGARALAAAGLLEGGCDLELDALEAAFAGPTPWSVDFY